MNNVKEIEVYPNKRIRSYWPEDDKRPYDFNGAAFFLEYFIVIKDQQGKIIQNLPLDEIKVYDGREKEITKDYPERLTRDDENRLRFVHYTPLNKAGTSIDLRISVQSDGKEISKSIKTDLPPSPDWVKLKPKSKFGEELFLLALRIKVKKISTWAHFVLLFLFPCLLLLAFLRFNIAGSSILVGIIMSIMASGISAEINFFGWGAVFGLICGLINFLFPPLFQGTAILTLIVYAIFGWSTWLIEDITSDDVKIFPWVMVGICSIMAAFNILQAFVLGSWGVNEYLNLIYNLVYRPEEPGIILKHILPIAQKFADYNYYTLRGLAETSRGIVIISQIFEALQWTIAGIICFTVSIPGKLLKFWQNLRFGGFKDAWAWMLGILGVGGVTKRKRGGAS